MGFPLFRYLSDCDPLEFNFRLLVLNGFWPPNTRNKVKNILYSIYSFICLFSLAHIFFIEVLDIYLIREDLVKVTKNLCATSVSFAAVFKQVIIFQKIGNVRKLYDKLIDFKTSRTNPEEVEILERADKKISLTTKATYSLAVPCISTWMLYPGIESADEKEVPFPYRLPTENWSTPVYELVYTYHSLSMIGFMITLISNDLVYYGMVIRINAEYEILMKKLKALKGVVNKDLNEKGENVTNEESNTVYDPDLTETAKVLLKDCCVFHQDILTKIEELKVVYGNPYLVHFIAAVTLVGSIIMDITVVSKGFQLQILQRVIYSATGVFDTFLCCFFTTQMQQQSYKLSRSVYSTPWYKLNPKIRKDLLLMSVRSMKPSAVRVGNFFPLNLETFLQERTLSSLKREYLFLAKMELTEAEEKT